MWHFENANASFVRKRKIISDEDLDQRSSKMVTGTEPQTL
jgi:hypothetical protein